MVSEDIGHMLKCQEGHMNKLIYTCPLGHNVFESAKFGRTQHCNSCLEPLWTDDGECPKGHLCGQCGFALCAFCGEEWAWINSLFPPSGRLWMRLVMERFERGTKNRLDFEQFKIFWLGQAFPYWRNMIFQGARHLGRKLRGGRKSRCHTCYMRIRKCAVGNTEDDLFDLLEEGGEEGDDDDGEAVGGQKSEMEMMRAMRQSVTVTADQVAALNGKSAERVPVKLLVFDFDLTLAGVHVFMAMAGGDHTGVLKPPYAVSEKGQLRRCMELGEKFSIKVMGGQARVTRLKQSLETLKGMGVEMVVCSKGLVGTIRKILRDIEVLDYFKQVYGNIGDSYGSCGQYDVDADKKWTVPASVSDLLGTKACTYSGGKASLIVELKKQREYSRKQVMLLEDDENEVESARGICCTHHVKSGCGLTADDFDFIVEQCTDKQ